MRYCPFLEKTWSRNMVFFKKVKASDKITALEIASFFHLNSTPTYILSLQNLFSYGKYQANKLMFAAFRLVIDHHFERGIF